MDRHCASRVGLVKSAPVDLEADNCSDLSKCLQRGLSRGDKSLHTKQLVLAG